MPTDNTPASAPNAKTTQVSRKTKTMKVLAKFLGRVHAFNPSPDFSYVTLKNVDNGEVVDSNAITEELVKAGVTKVDDEFEVLVIQDDEGKTVGRITKLEPREVTPEQVAAIVKEVDDKLGVPPCYDI